MIIYSKVTEAPASEPVTVDEAKAWCKVDGTDEDAIFTRLIKVSRIMCESYAGLSFITQTRVVKLDRFTCRDVILPYGPVTAVTEFAYKDGNGDAQTVAADTYTLDTQSGLAKVRVTDTWPDTDRTLNNVEITYTAGYDDEEVPEIAKQAILMQVATMYENRQDEVIGSSANVINYSSQMLLDTIKVYWNAEV